MQVKTLKVDTCVPLTENCPSGSYDHPRPPGRGKLIILQGTDFLPVERDHGTYGILWQFEQKKGLAEIEDWTSV